MGKDCEGLQMKVYIDGEYGAVGLHLSEQIKKTQNVELLSISEEDKKNIEIKKEYLNSADCVFLCLPDDIAIESANLVENQKTVIIDCSTAHRTKWTYGFPELGNQFLEGIKTSNKITNPGCHATGFISIIYPLVKNRIVNKNDTIYCYSLTGYTGGGKVMIEEWQDKRDASIYSLDLNHKHIPEMMKVCGLEAKPFFSPAIVDIPQGMIVSIMLNQNYNKVFEIINQFYEQTDIEVSYRSNKLNVSELAGTDKLKICVSGNENQSLISACFDNLGKGASGAAIQNMKVRFGLC